MLIKEVLQLQMPGILSGIQSQWGVTLTGLINM
jgi:hypothetical protein